MRNLFAFLFLLIIPVLSADAMDSKKLCMLSKVMKIKAHNTKIPKRNFHASASSINKKMLLEEHPRELAVFAKKFKEGNYYFMSDEITTTQNGAWGAYLGFWAGKIIIHGTAQTIIWGVGAASNLVVPGAGAIVVPTLQATILPVAEGLSNVVGVGVAIAAGTVTGPV